MGVPSPRGADSLKYGLVFFCFFYGFLSWLSSSQRLYGFESEGLACWQEALWGALAAEREKKGELGCYSLQSRIRNLNFASSSPCGSSSTEIPLSSRMTYDCMLPVSFPIDLLHKTNKRKLTWSDWCIDRSRYRNNPLQQSEVAFVSKRSFSKWWSLLASVSFSPSHPPHPSFLFFALAP